MHTSVFVCVLVAGSCAAADFTSYAGDANECRATAIAIDAAGNSYVTGVRVFPGTNTAPGNPALGRPLTDVFVTKLNPAGQVLFTTTMSGKSTDASSAIAVDPAGNIYVAGSTFSVNFPVRNALYTLPPEAAQKGFVVKLGADGRIIYSTYFPGIVNGIAADGAGNAYVTGQTATPDFPATTGLPHGIVTRSGPGQIIGAFISKISADGSRILYSTVISGNTVSCGSGSSCFLSTRGISGNAIALDAAGSAYVAGGANVTDLPTTSSAPVPRGIGGWVAKINATGNSLEYLTYVGQTNRVFGTSGLPANQASAIAVDSGGNAYVVGATTDPRLGATAGAFRTTFHGPDQVLPQLTPADAFVVKLNPQGTAFSYATYLGGSAEDSATAVGVDSGGNAYVTGRTASGDFPRSVGEGLEFVVRLNGAGSALDYAFRFPSGIASRGMAVEASGRLHLAGMGAVVSTVTPGLTSGMRIYGVANAAAYMAPDVVGGSISGRADAGEVISIYGAGLAPTTPVTAIPDSSGRIPTTLGGVRVLFNELPAPLLYVSDTQINAVVPFGLSGMTTAEVRIIFGGNETRFRAMVAEATPQIFRVDSRDAALNEDGSINSRENPAKAGSVVAIWATGFDRLQFFPRLVDGEITTTPANLSPYAEVFVDGVQIGAQYAGPAPGMVAGITQINFRIPPTVQRPTVTVTLRRPNSSGFTSQGAGVWVNP